MTDELSQAYAEYLTGSYDSPDRIVLNAYFRQGHIPGGFRNWWRSLYGNDDDLDKTLRERAPDYLVVVWDAPMPEPMPKRKAFQ